MEFYTSDSNFITIYGKVRGYAIKHMDPWKHYKFEIRYFINSKSFKISNPKDLSVTSVEKLKERIDRIYNEDLNNEYN